MPIHPSLVIDHPLVRASADCPLCFGTKEPGLVVCWGCYRTYGMRDGSEFAECMVDRAEDRLAGKPHARDTHVGPRPSTAVAVDPWALNADLLAALESACATLQKLVDIDRLPPNSKGLRDGLAAIAKARGEG